MHVLSVVIPQLKLNQLRWSFTGAFEARQSLIVRGLFPMLADPRHPSLERCQLKNAIAGKPEKLDALAGDPGIVPGSCPNRKESQPLNSRSASLFLMNYFPTIPVMSEACKEHSEGLGEMVNACYKASRNALPNYVAVNFYMNKRGGKVKLKSILMPLSKFDHPEKGYALYGGRTRQ